MINYKFNPPKAYDYPMIMQGDQMQTVLFTGAGIGVVLASGASGFSVGFQCTNFNMDLYDVFYGTLELSNG